MKLDAAKRFCAALQNAIALAESQGRDELTHADLESFAAQDDDARASLEAAIKKAEQEGR